MALAALSKLGKRGFEVGRDVETDKGEARVVQFEIMFRGRCLLEKEVV